MSSTTYVAGSGRERLHQAQAELYQHLHTDASGRCRTCGEIEPCTTRRTLNQTILGYGSLPRRRPGLTSTPATRPSGRGWFDRTTEAQPAA